MAKELGFVMLLDCYGDLLTDHQRNVMEQYYCDDLSLAEISEPLGITRQAVLNVIKRTGAILKEYEDKLGFVKRLTEMRRHIDSIEKAAAGIDDDKLRKNISSEVKALTELL